MKIFLGAAFILAAGTASAADFAVIHAGTLLSVPGRPAQERQSVVVKNGRIAAVLPGFADAAAAGAGASDKVTIYDLSRFFVLPGLIDGHVHLEGELSPTAKLEAVERSDAALALVSLKNAEKTLLSGFTTVRDVGSGDEMFAVRDVINAGQFTGARIFAAGQPIAATGGHGDVHGYRQDVLDLFAPHAVCNGAEDCRRAVREAVKRGADEIKLTATGGVLSETAAGTEVQFFDDELKAIVDTGHLLGRRVTAHAHGTKGINAALRAGVDSIEHGSYADQDSIELFKNLRAYLVPTLLAGATVTSMATPDDTFLPAPIRAKALQVGPVLIENLRRAHKAGVPIAFGTDTGVSKHGENAKEFALMVEAGMTPIEAIRAATVSGAANLGKSNDLGSIEAGKFGDLIAVSGDPTIDVNELLDVDFVMKEGVAYKTPQ